MLSIGHIEDISGVIENMKVVLLKQRKRAEAADSSKIQRRT